MADFVAVALRGLAFAAVLQAAGAVIFRLSFGQQLDQSRQRLHGLVLSAAIAGLVLTLAHALVEPARLTGELGGIFDSTLHRLLLGSAFGETLAVRVLGLAMIIGGCLRTKHRSDALALIGAALILGSFTLMGHTAADPQRFILAPLLLAHLLTLAFWFGSLLPLVFAAELETAAAAGRLIERFSRLAIALVPLLLVAGIAMTSLLLPGLAGLRTPYGSLLLTKLGGFGVLMLLAAANKWRFGPRLAGGELRARVAFQRTVWIEWLLILAVVIVTAAMTALFTPEA